MARPSRCAACGHGGVRALLAGAVGVTRYARIVLAVAAELVEQVAGEVVLRGDGGGDLCGIGQTHGCACSWLWGVETTLRLAG